METDGQDFQHVAPHVASHVPSHVSSAFSSLPYTAHATDSERSGHWQAKAEDRNGNYPGIRQLHPLPPAAAEGGRDGPGKRVFHTSTVEDGAGDCFGKRQLYPLPVEEGFEDYSGTRLFHSLPVVEGIGDYSGKRLFHPLPMEEGFADYSTKRLFYHSPVDEEAGDYAGKRPFHPHSEEGYGDYAGKRLFYPLSEEGGGGHYYESDSGVSSLYEPVSYPPTTTTRLDTELDDADSQLGMCSTRTLQPAGSKSSPRFANS